MYDISAFEHIVENSKQKREDKQQKKINTHYEAVNEIKSKISAYKDRMIKILDMWKTIREKDPYVYNKYKDRLSSDTFKHTFGFLGSYDAIGCYGGGGLGDDDFEVRRDGKIIFDEKPHLSSYYPCPDKRLLGPQFTTARAYAFPNDFENFEKKFYEIVKREYKAS